MKKLFGVLFFFLAVAITAQAQSLRVKVINNHSQVWSCGVVDNNSNQTVIISNVLPNSGKSGTIASVIGPVFTSAVLNNNTNISNGATPAVLVGPFDSTTQTVSGVSVTWTLSQDPTTLDYVMGVHIN